MRERRRQQQVRGHRQPPRRLRSREQRQQDPHRRDKRGREAEPPDPREEDERVIVTPLLLQDLEEQRRRSRHTFPPVMAGGLDLDHPVVETFRRRDGIAARPAPERVIAGDRAGGIEAGGHMGEDPVMVAVAREVLDVGEDFLAARDRFPKQLEDAARHAGMADDAVRLAEDLILRISGLGSRSLGRHVGFSLP